MNTEKQTTENKSAPAKSKNEYQSTLAKVTACFSEIVEMDELKRECIQSCMSYFNGGELVNPFISAEKGKGKTRILKAYAAALEIVGLTALVVTPSEFRKSDDVMFGRLKSILQSDGYALLVDEFHELFVAQGATVQLKKIGNLFLKALDGNFKGGKVNLGDDVYATYNRKTCVLGGATNYPSRVNEAIKSRMFEMQMPDYSELGLQHILQGMAKRAGLTLKADAAKIVAKSGRGNARPMEQIVRQLGISLSSAEKQRKEVEREDVIDALRSLQMFPRGLNVSEMKMLESCIAKAMPDRMLIAMFPDLDSQAVRKSRSFLMLPTEDKEGNRVSSPLLEAVVGGFQTTEKGKRFLLDVRKAGFSW